MPKIVYNPSYVYWQTIQFWVWLRILQNTVCQLCQSTNNPFGLCLARLELLAEVGGYFVLFLGVSVNLLGRQSQKLHQNNTNDNNDRLRLNIYDCSAIKNKAWGANSCGFIVPFFMGLPACGDDTKTAWYSSTWRYL